MAAAPDDDVRRRQILLLLAERLGFVTPQEADEAMQAAGKDTAELLGRLVADGVLTATERVMLETIADELILAHGGDFREAYCRLIGFTPSPDSHATPTMPVEPTDSGRYEKKRPLSMTEDGAEKGGMGEVYVAQDRHIDRVVVMKQIREESALRQEYQSQFLLETRITGALEHPNIVPMYDAGTHPDGNPYYITRFIAGDTLSQAIRRHHPRPPGQTEAARSLALRDLLGRFVDVCEAVAFAHSRGYIHRDIKPANILLGSFGETYLIDWGLVMRFARPEAGRSGDSVADDDGARRRHDRAGTLPYKAPEQEEGDVDRLGPHSDVYGLGATLYHLLVGRHAFAGVTTPIGPDVVRGVFPRPRQVNAEVAPALEAICLKAMANAPVDRYRSAKELAADIERVLADEPVAVYRDPWTVRAVRFARRHRTALSAAAVLLVTSVVALAVNNVLVGRQRDIARTSTGIAKDVISELIVGLQDSLWKSLPGTVPKRIELIENAERKYAALLDLQPDDPDVLVQYQEMLTILAVLYEANERDDDYERTMGRAIDMARRLGASGPRGGYTAHLAIALKEHAEHVKDHRGPSAAAPVFQEAHELARESGDPPTLALVALERALNRALTGRIEGTFHDMLDACDILDREASTAEMQRTRDGLSNNAILGRAEAAGVALLCERITDARATAIDAEQRSRPLTETDEGFDARYIRAMALLMLSRVGMASQPHDERNGQLAEDAVAAAREAEFAGGGGNLASRVLLARALAGRAGARASRTDADRVADLEEGIRLFEVTGANAPRIPYVAAATVGSLRADLAVLHRTCGRSEEAEAEARRAISLLEPLARTDPADPVIAAAIGKARGVPDARR